MSIPQALEFIAERDGKYPDLKIGPGGNVMVQDDGDGAYIKEWPAEYGDQPTAQELTDATEIAGAAKAANQARIAKYAADTAAGFTSGGKTYSLAAASLDNWQKLATTLRAEVDAGITEETEEVPLFTTTGEVVALEAGDALTLLAQIGKTAQELQTRDYQWAGMIAQATTAEQLAGIQAVIELA